MSKICGYIGGLTDMFHSEKGMIHGGGAVGESANI